MAKNAAMADSATMTAPGNLDQPADGTQVTIRTMAMDAEVFAIVELDCEQRGVRYYRNLGEHVYKTYAVLRKRQAIGGDGTVSIRQLTCDLYPDVGGDFAAYRRKRASVKRWLAILVRQGLLERDVLRSENGGGKCLGLRTELLPVPEKVAMLAASRGCSSVG
jgi:hypothetical protein